jgi:putative MATE family efflux protein
VELLPQATTYLRVLWLGFWITALMNLFSTALTSVGDSKSPLVALAISSVVNIVLDIVFLAWLDMGIGGAGAATLLSQCFSMSFLFLLLISSKSELKIRPGYIARSPVVYLRILKQGMPSFWRQGVLSLATMSINYNARIYGDAAVAALAICTKVFQMINSVIIGFGHGFQPVLGFNYGAKRWDRVKEAVVFSVKICFTILFCASVVGFFLAPHIVTLFRDDPDVISIGTRVFRFQCLVMPTFSVAVFSNMFFQALGKSWRATILAIARPGFLIPMSFLLTGTFGLTGLELAQPVADFFSFLIGAGIMIHYFKCEFGKE